MVTSERPGLGRGECGGEEGEGEEEEEEARGGGGHGRGVWILGEETVVGCVTSGEDEVRGV